MTNTKKQSAALMNTPGTIILQWLTYAFWGWTIVAVSYLVAVVVGAALPDVTYPAVIGEPVAYGAAAVLILLPISLICDILFSKNELTHKSNISTVIMVIHAVLFAIIAIGSLVVLLFTVISWILSTTGSAGPLTPIVTAATVAILFGLLFTRTIKPRLCRAWRLVFRIVFVVIAVGITTLAVIGPVAETLRTKDDRAVRENLSLLQSGVSQYVYVNKMLPGTINDIYSSQYIYNSSVLKELVSRNLITYTPNTKPATTVENASSYFYELCGVYTHGLSDGMSGGIESVSTTPPSGGKDGYITWIEQGPVAAGKQCYKLIATNYSDTPIQQ